MIDIHSHVLPGFDDGLKSLEEAVRLSQLMTSGGVTTLFVTPHITGAPDLENSRRIESSMASLQAALDERGAPLRFLPGAEVAPTMDLLDWLDRGFPILLGTSGRYLLLDCPPNAIPPGLGRLVFALQTRRVTPILAHPERGLSVQQKPDSIEALVENGLLTQISARSILGRHGKAAKDTARVLLRHHWVHFVASDSHSISSHEPLLPLAAQALIELIGRDEVLELTQRNGARVAAGEEVPTNPLPYKAGAGTSWLRRVGLAIQPALGWRESSLDYSSHSPSSDIRSTSLRMLPKRSARK